MSPHGGPQSSTGLPLKGPFYKADIRQVRYPTSGHLGPLRPFSFGPPRMGCRSRFEMWAPVW